MCGLGLMGKQMNPQPERKAGIEFVWIASRQARIAATVISWLHTCTYLYITCAWPSIHTYIHAYMHMLHIHIHPYSLSVCLRQYMGHILPENTRMHIHTYTYMHIISINTRRYTNIHTYLS